MTNKGACLYKPTAERLALAGVSAKRASRSPACSVFAPPEVEGLWLRTALVRGPNYPKQEPEPICQAEDVVRLVGALRDRAVEEFVAIPLGGGLRPKGIVQIAKGGVDKAMVDAGEVVRAALLSGASRVIVVHNHPSGNPAHSADDRRVVSRLAMALQLVGVSLEDSIVVGSGGVHESYREVNGEMPS